MLGKTNITTIEKDNIVSNIEEYIWKNTGLNGVSGTFVKAVYENDIIVGITRDGTIAYTRDGENWEVTRLDLEDRYELSDIIWDGSRYVMVGSKAEGEIVHGLIAVSDDLADFTITIETDCYCSKYFTILKKDSGYILISAESGKARTIGTEIKFMSRVGDLTDWESEVSIPIGFPSNGKYYLPEYFDRIYVGAAKKTNGFLLYLKYPIYSTTSVGHHVYASPDGVEFISFCKQGTNTGDKPYNQQMVSVFECKDSLYFLWIHTDFSYGLHKIIGIGEEAVMTTGINFAFVDAVYFNKCEIFINNHEMLVINPGERISDKTLDNLVEITYDFSMTSIVKAFGKLYVFGTDGKVLVSGDEMENEESTSVKTMSAAKALYDAKAYTDKKCKEITDSLETIVAAYAEQLIQN